MFATNKIKTTEVGQVNLENNGDQLTNASKNENQKSGSEKQEIDLISSKRNLSISTPHHPRLVGITEAYGIKPNTPLQVGLHFQDSKRNFLRKTVA